MINIDEKDFSYLVNNYYDRRQLANYFNCGLSTVDNRLYKWSLSIKTYKINTDITQNVLHNIFDYNMFTGDFIWLVKTGPNSKVGNKAGSKNADGYICIGLNSKIYKAHRLAWLYMTGSWPTDQIDHKDRIRSNNIWSNLRDVSNSDNQLNTGLRRNNTSGFKGVSFDSTRQKWLVQYRGKYIGRFNYIEEATIARERAEEAYY